MTLLEKTINSLKKNRIASVIFESGNDVLEYLDSIIEDTAIVGVGDSVTLETIGIYDYLKNRNIVYLDKYDKTLGKLEKRELYLKNFNSDYFLSSANAISSDGKIYNMDGNGSRVAPIIYGPKKVFLVCGTNKIVETEEQAFERIKAVAAPLDAKRLNKKTPCAITGKCSDCKSPDRICNYYSVIQGQFDGGRISVVFIQEQLGY